MGRSTFSGPVKSVAGIEVGSAGTQITHIQKGTVTVDPASLAANTAAQTSATVSGAVVGDIVIVNPPAAGLTAGLVICACYVSAANTVKITLLNTTGSAIDQASTAFNYTLIRS